MEVSDDALLLLASFLYPGFPTLPLIFLVASFIVLVQNDVVFRVVATVRYD